MKRKFSHSLFLNNLRGLLFNIQRAGLRRIYYRLMRFFKLKIINPYFGNVMYSFSQNKSKNIKYSNYELQKVLSNIIKLKSSAPINSGWDYNNGLLSLLNQEPISLKKPIDWKFNPISDPLWSYCLHSWDWSWKALKELSLTSKSSFKKILYDWITKVKAGKGLAWEPFPTSRRLVVWCAVAYFIDGAKYIFPSIRQHAQYLSHNIEKDLDNNHIIANAKALTWAGYLFPEFQEAKQWREIGESILWRSLREQVRLDGGHFENSTTYHLSVWLDALETAKILQACGRYVPEDIWILLKKMGLFAIALRRPDGGLPLLNDSIGDEPVPFKNAFSFANETFTYDNINWISGKRKYSNFPFNSIALKDSGYVIFRSGWKKNDTYLVFDAGNLGPDHIPGHGHADTLSFELWAKGENLIVDPGVYQYTKSEWRDYFRSTSSHSTITIDRLDQSTFCGAFRVADIARGKLLDFNLNDSNEMAIGEHDGYTRLSDPVIHRRTVRFLSKDQIIIDDLILGRSEHEINIYFHLTKCKLHINNDFAEAIFPLGTKLIIISDKIMRGSLKKEKGWVSRTWYKKQETPVLVYTLRSKLPISISTCMMIK